MKKIIGLILLFLLVIGTSAPAYVNPMGNISLEEAREAAGVEKADEEGDLYSEDERLSRATDLWGEEETRVKIVSYPDPAMGYGPLGEFHTVEALEYEYPDGTTEIISSDGRILKERR